MNHHARPDAIKDKRLYPINLKRVADSEAKYPGALLEQLYIKQGLSQHEIARQLGIRQNRVSVLLKARGIPSRPAGLHDPTKRRGYKDGSQSRKYRRLKRYLPKACERCGEGDKLVVHHKDNDHFNHALENLIVLCVGCHSTEHKRLWWSCKKARLPYKKSNGPSGWNR